MSTNSVLEISCQRPFDIFKGQPFSKYVDSVCKPLFISLVSQTEGFVAVSVQQVSDLPNPTK